MSVKKILYFCAGFVFYTPVVLADPCVILLHGLARTSGSMDKMQTELSQAGYKVVNHDYPSREKGILDLADKEIPKAVAGCQNAEQIHFITHSLGGILVRQYLSKHSLPQLKRVVMLGPPNQGSEVVDALQNVPGYNWLNGPAGYELGTDSRSIPLQLGAVDFELGIIAGTSTINFILSQFLENPDDGKVSVKNTKVDGMSDHITVDVSHPFLMRDDKVIQQSLYFLEHGNFEREDHNDSIN